MSIEKAYGAPIARNQQAIHVLNRLAFGPRPGDIDEVNRIGATAYIQRQLERDSIPEPPELQERLDALPTLRMTPMALFEEFQQPIRQAQKGDKSAKQEARHEAKIVMMEAVQARIIRALLWAAPVTGSDDGFLVQPFQYLRRQGALFNLDRRL